MVKSVKNKWLYNCARTGLIAGLGFGLTACMENNVRSYGQSYANTSAQPAAVGYHANTHSSHGYYSFKPSAKPYVLQAQNNVISPENGLRNHFQKTQRIVTPQSSFVHHLDDIHPIVPQAALSPQIGVRSSDQQRVFPAQTLNYPRQNVPSEMVAPSVTVNHTRQPAAQSSRYPDQNLMPKIVPIEPAFQSRTVVPPTTSVKAIHYPSQPVPLSEDATRATLNQSLTEAVNRSLRLAIEDIKIQEAEEGLIQAKSQGRFKLNLDGVAGLGQYETDFSVVNRTDSSFRAPRAANLDLSLPIYQGGRINAQKDLAKVGIKTAKANYDTVQNNVILEAAVAHLNVIRDRQLIQIYSQNVSLLGSQKETVKALVNAGENTLTDEALLDARLASIQVQLKQVESNLAASESNYRKLTGRKAPDLMPVGQAALPASLQETKQAVLQNNHQVKTAQTQIEAAYHDIQVAKSLGRPKLALQGVLRAAEGQSDTIRRNSAAEVLLNLSVPLLSGGENKSRLRQATLAQSRAALETRALQEDLMERVEQLWASVQSARLNHAPNQAQKHAAQKAYDAIVIQRNAGVATSLDVLTVEQSVLDAEINLVQAQNIENVSRFQLLALMGALN